MPEDPWRRVADGVFQRRYDPVDVSVGVILGSSGVTVIDTRNNPEEAEEIIRDVTERFDQPIVDVINTHAHYDHTFGNQVFRARSIPVYGHHLIPHHFEAYEEPRLRRVQEEPATEVDKSWKNVVLTPPSVLIDKPRAVQLGGRDLELLPLAPGHTDTDMAVLVPDAGVWFLGDIIESSGPPMFGSGAHPLGWATVLSSLLELIEPSHVVVPGHGNPVNRDFVARQQQLFERLATEISNAYAHRTPVEDIKFSEELGQLWPDEFLREAANDGYAQQGD